MSAESSPLPETSPSPSPVPSAEIESVESDEEIYEGEAIVETAKEFLGYDYVYGGESPRAGFDCSGLLYYAYKQHGYLLYRIANDQATQGMEIESTDDLLPGDLLCFMTGNYCGHIGMYVEGGQFIQAMDSAHGVIMSSLEEYMERYGLKIRRIVGYMDKKSAEEIEEIEELRRQENEDALKAALAAKESPMPTPESGDVTSTPDSNIYIIPTPTPAPIPIPEDPTEEESTQEEAAPTEDNSAPAETVSDTPVQESVEPVTE